jgi:propanol-preferring alcohol dehydrogenase
VIVGSGGGQLAIRKPGPLPAGCRVWLPYWGTRTELTDVVALARTGAVRVEVERFPLTDAVRAIERLRAGTLAGRAVQVP